MDEVNEALAFKNFDENEVGVLEKWVVHLPLPPCWDESDDGVPPFCRGHAPVAWWKVFNPQNRYTNDNLVMIAFGNVGFMYFDRRRKYWMGAAMWSTLLSICFTIAGCFALSTNMRIVKDVHWVWIRLQEETSGEISIARMGLRSLVYTHEPCNPSFCKRDNYVYGDADMDWPNEYLKSAIDECREIAVGTQFGAFTTCATLVFALIGTMNRMRFKSDANIQKALGMVTDTCGFISLFLTLFNVYQSCWTDLPREYTGSDGVTFLANVYMGPGYVCYLFCLFGAFMRCVFHWLTPLPGRGSGCTPKLPKSLVEKLDKDGDGEVSWAELRMGYEELVAERAEALRNFRKKANETGESTMKHIPSVTGMIQRVRSRSRTPPRTEKKKKEEDLSGVGIEVVVEEPTTRLNMDKDEMSENEPLSKDEPAAWVTERQPAAKKKSANEEDRTWF